MNDDELKDLYSRGLVRPDGSSRELCPDPEALQAIAEDRASDGQRLETMRHVALCLPCQRDLALLGQIADAEPRSTSLTPAWIASAAAVVALAIGGVLWLRSPVDPVLRGASDVVLVAPSGQVSGAAARSLVWQSVPRAIRYELEILDNDGNVVADADVTDTVMAMPTEVVASSVPYRWRITAVRQDGTRLESSLGSFTIAGR